MVRKLSLDRPAVLSPGSTVGISAHRRQLGGPHAYL